MGDNYLGNNVFPAAQNIAGMALGIPLAAIQIANSGNPLQYLQQRSQLLQDPNFRALAGPFTAGLLEVAGGQQPVQNAGELQRAGLTADQAQQLGVNVLGPGEQPRTQYQPNLPPLNPVVGLQQAEAQRGLQALPGLSPQEFNQAFFGVAPHYPPPPGYIPARVSSTGVAQYVPGPQPLDPQPVPGIPGLYYDANQITGQRRPFAAPGAAAIASAGPVARARAQAAADVQNQQIQNLVGGLQPPSAPPAAPPATPAPAPAAAPAVALPQGYVPPASLTPDQLNAPLNPSPAFDDRVGFPPPAFDDQNVQVQTPRGQMTVPAWSQQLAQAGPTSQGIPALPSPTRPAPTPLSTPLADLSSRLPPRSSLSVGPRGTTFTARGPAGDKSDFTKAAGQKALQVLMRAKESIVRLRQAGVLTDNALTGTLGYNRAALEYTARFSDDRQARDDATFLLRNLQSTVPTLARGFGEQRVNQQEEQRIREALSFNRVPSTFAESVIDNYISLFGGQPQAAPSGARILQFTPRQ